MALIFYRPAISEILVGDELMALFYITILFSKSCEVAVFWVFFFNLPKCPKSVHSLA
jgi:hypothetical protein